MNTPDPLISRQDTIQKFKQSFYDLIVIGGGVTGAGIALDAALRGLRVALVEKNDFASGTSSKSTKLIHGGLRYLKQYEFNLVREVGSERAIVHKLASHLVRPEKMLLPLITDGNYGKIITSVGLMVYDVLADVKTADQRKMLSKEETMSLEPLLDEDIIEGGGLYAEYQTDDFRLVIELLKTAVSHGADVMNYMQCQSFLEKGGVICGIEAFDRLSGEGLKIYGDYVINAAGPWVDKVRGRQEEVRGKKLKLTKGVHLVVPFDKLPVRQSIYFDVEDGRMIFAIPYHDVSYIGTTDTDYADDPSEAVVTKKDADYLINAVNKAFPSTSLTLADVVSSWAGVRPLIEEEGKSASEISRKDEIFVSEKGLISIAGGKLTGYRKMAKRAIDMMIKIRSEHNTDFRDRPCNTRKTKLIGNEFKNYKAVLKYKKKLKEDYSIYEDKEIDYLVNLYGKQTKRILTMHSEDKRNAPLIISELIFCLQHEMVFHLTDFFIQRTGRLFFDIESVRKHLVNVAQKMQDVLGWSNEELKTEIHNMKKEISKATTFQ